MDLSIIAPNNFRKQSLRVMALIPVKKRQGKRYWEIKKFIDAAQWWSKEEIEKWQLTRFKEILKYAYDNVPGYNLLYNDAKIKVEDIQSLADVKFLPFVTKHILQENPKDFLSRSVPQKDLLYVTTGGSTGIPFGFYHTKLNFSMENAFTHSGWERVGWKLGDDSVLLRGEFVGSEKNLWKYNYYKKELTLSSYYLTEKNYKKYFDKLIKKTPLHLQAYPSAATILADMILAHNDAGKIKFKIVLLASENVYDWQKAKIQAAFPGAKIFSFYGHAEHTILAAMCEHSMSYHVWPFYGITEILDEKGMPVEEGASGEMVGTSFWNYGTPFIRYRTMDIAQKGAFGCKACGRQFQLLDKIEGRLQEMIITKTGRYISMTAINMHDDIFNNLKQFQFLQEEQGKVFFRFVPRNPLSGNEINEIKNRIMPKLGEDMELFMQEVSIIPKTRRGKHQFLEQKLNVKYGDR